jgi:hypothetical protein
MCANDGLEATSSSGRCSWQLRGRVCPIDVHGLVLEMPPIYLLSQPETHAPRLALTICACAQNLDSWIVVMGRDPPTLMGPCVLLHHLALARLFRSFSFSRTLSAYLSASVVSH